MACWITVHYPHPIDGGIPYYIYLKDDREGRHVRPGDRVLFYVGKYPPGIDGVPTTHVTRTRHGVSERVQIERTPGGIVGVATVAGGIEPNDAHREYEYGNSTEWGYQIPCQGFQRGNLVTREAYRQIAGRGIAVRTGLYQIDRHVFDRVVAALGVGGNGVGESVVTVPVAQSRSRAEIEATLARCGVTNAGWLLDRVQHVAGQPERNTEDVVKAFLLALGHDEATVSFQRGRIDISVANRTGGTHMVVEVKRDLRSPREARRQAFDYALETDARIVVLTDADRYEVYDRKRGGGYDAMLAGSFSLASLTSDDCRVVALLRPMD